MVWIEGMCENDPSTQPETRNLHASWIGSKLPRGSRYFIKKELGL